MAFERVNSAGVVMHDAGVELTAGTATAFAVGDIVSIQPADAGVIRATSSHDNNGATRPYGIATQVKASSGTTSRVLPLVNGMLLRADLANNSSSSHNGDRMSLTDHDTLNNSGTDDTTDTGIFMQLYPVGPATDRKAIVQVVGLGGQVTA